MRINRHIAFSSKEHYALKDYVITNKLPFEEGIIAFSFDIYEDDVYWPFVKEYIERENIFSYANIDFSQEEIDNAEWMRVRSVWNFGYPQPEGDFTDKEITYNYNASCPICKRGFEQIDSFRIKKAPKWGNKHFAMLFGVDDELFISETAKIILEKNCTGISFCEVKNKNGKDVFEGVYQLKILNKLTEGIINEKEISKDLNFCCSCGTGGHGDGSLVSCKNYNTLQ